MDCRLLFIGIMYTAVASASDDRRDALSESIAELPFFLAEKTFFAKQPEEVIGHLSEQERSVNLMKAIESWQQSIRLSGNNTHMLWVASNSPENLKRKCIEAASDARKAYATLEKCKNRLQEARDKRLHDDCIARCEKKFAKAETNFREKGVLMQSFYDEYIKATIKQ